jgi:hypothetical protein
MYGVAPNAFCRHDSMAARVYVFVGLGTMPQDFKNYFVCQRCCGSAAEVSGRVYIPRAC